AGLAVGINLGIAAEPVVEEIAEIIPVGREHVDIGRARKEYVSPAGAVGEAVETFRESLRIEIEAIGGSAAGEDLQHAGREARAADRVVGTPGEIDAVADVKAADHAAGEIRAVEFENAAGPVEGDRAAGPAARRNIEQPAVDRGEAAAGHERINGA